MASGVYGKGSLQAAYYPLSSTLPSSFRWQDHLFQLSRPIIMAPIAVTPPAIEVKSLESLKAPVFVNTPKLNTTRKIICFSDFDGTIFNRYWPCVTPAHPLQIKHQLIVPSKQTSCSITSAAVLNAARSSMGRSTVVSVRSRTFQRRCGARWTFCSTMVSK
jgi:hypothetical protein